MKNGKKHNELFTPLVIMTITIIVLSVISQYFINESLKDIKAYVNTLYVVNQERMLSQDIVKSIATDNLVGQQDQMASLDILIDRFKNFHHIILTGNKQLNVPPLDPEFAHNYRILDTAFYNFSDIIDLNADDENDDNTLFVELLKAQQTYMSKLNNLDSAVNQYSNAKVERFQLIQILAMCGSLIILILEFILIFLPAFNKIKKQNKHLREIAFNQSHLVRHPLTNLKDLLYLISTSKSSEELEELVSLAKTEADELDTIISNTIYSAAQSEPA